MSKIISALAFAMARVGVKRARRERYEGSEESSISKSLPSRSSRFTSISRRERGTFPEEGRSLPPSGRSQFNAR